MVVLWLVLVFAFSFWFSCLFVWFWWCFGGFWAMFGWVWVCGSRVGLVFACLVACLLVFGLGACDLFAFVWLFGVVVAAACASFGCLLAFCPGCD